MYFVQRFNSFVVLALVFMVQASTDHRPIRSEFEGGTVRAFVNEKPVLLLLDSGAVRCGLDEDFRKAMGIKVLSEFTVAVPSGTVSIPLCESVDLTIDRYPVRSVEPAQLPRQMFGGSGRRIDGIVGLDVLSSHVLVITSGSVSIRDSVPSRFDVIQRFDLRHVDSRVPAVPTVPVLIPTLEGQQIKIDTGSNECIRLEETIIASLRGNQQIVSGLSYFSSDAKGTASGTGYILREMIVGGVRFRNVPVSAAHDNAIGLEVLRHLNLALDFPKGRILVGKPPQEMVDYFPQNGSGMGTRFDADDNLRVLAVRPSGAAELAGIEVGDIVVVLGNKKPVELSIYDVNDILAQNGRTIPVKLRRDNTDFTVNLPLKLPFEYPPNWALLDKGQKAFDQFLREQDNKDLEEGKKCR